MMLYSFKVSEIGIFACDRGFCRETAKSRCSTMHEESEGHGLRWGQ